MTGLTRRNALLAATATAAASAMPHGDTARAATPATVKQVAGWYRYKVGDIEVTVATDGVSRFKMAPNHVINVPLDTVNAALADMFMEKDMMTTPYNPIALNMGGKLV